MHVVSIIWFIAMSLMIIVSKKNRKVAIKNASGSNIRRLSTAKKTNNKFGLNSLVNRITKRLKSKKKKQNEQHLDTNLFSNEPPIVYLNTNKFNYIASEENISMMSSHDDVSKYHFTYDYENGTGELYMRCGAAIFSICAMIDRSLSLIQMIEGLVNNNDAVNVCKITFMITMANKITSLVFIFIQSFFVFKYANIIINYGKNSAAIGLMHIMCTNFCVSVRSVISKTISEIQQYSQQQVYPYTDSKKNIHSTAAVLIDKLSNTSGTYYIDTLRDKTNSYSLNSIKMKQLGCISISNLTYTSHIAADLQQAQVLLAPYLYPCIVEYSLMCLTVFFILWGSIEQRYIQSKEAIQEINVDKAIKNVEYRQEHQFTIDCGKSTTGLFVGFLVFLATILSCITYLIYKPNNEKNSERISEITELSLISLSLIVILLIFFKLVSNKFSQKHRLHMSYNEILIIVGLAGIYVYGFFTIIAIIDNGLNSYKEKISLTIQLVSIVESTLQSILIINALKMFSKDKQTKKSKPARSLITLLILINVSLWLFETVIVKKYDMNMIQLVYYDIIFWSIASSIATPLTIFFRFHASVCLSDIWKNLYE